MTIPQVTAFNGLVPPTRNDLVNFAQRGDDTMSRLPTFETQVNAVSTAMNTAVVDTLAARDTATAAAISVEGTANATKWTAKVYADGDKAWSPISYLTYRNKGAGARNTDPANDSVNWVPVVDNKPIYNAAESTTAVSVVLDANSATILEITPTAADLSVTLQDATTLKVGPATQIVMNKGEYDLAVRDKAGDLLAVVTAGGHGIFALFDKTTLAGEWRADGFGVRYVLAIKDKMSLSASSPAWGQCGVIKLSETLLIFIGRSSTTLYLQAYDLTTNTLGTAVTVPSYGGSGTPFHAAFAISATSGVVFAIETVNCHALAFTVAGTTITAGAIAVKAFPYNIGVFSYHGVGRQIAQLGASTFVTTGAAQNIAPFNAGVAACTVAGTVVTWGATLTMNANPAHGSIPYSIATFSTAASQVMAVTYASNSIIAQLVDVAGNTCTLAGGSVIDGSMSASAQPQAAVRMAADEMWLMSTSNPNKVNLLRLKRTGATTLAIKGQLMTGVTATDILYNHVNKYNMEGHGVFTKLDATSCVLVSPGTPNVGMYKITWDGANFISTGGTAMAPNASPMHAFIMPYVAGSAPGYYLNAYQGWVDPASNGYAPACMGAFSLASAAGATTPAMQATLPCIVAFNSTSSVYNEFDIVYRGNKAHIFNSSSPASHAMTDVISVDFKRGEVLAQHHVNRDGIGAAASTRTLITAKNGAVMVSVEASKVHIMEVAK